MALLTTVSLTFNLIPYYGTIFNDGIINKENINLIIIIILLLFGEE